ncbi:MAG: hypothetical protein NZ561_12100 [Phycisphaerae bacterium]|nr:hypothetical protein [Phycisphaerae bacterium]MDW8262719.1 hypothetical protein [Phycisphaerales bacterium]
MPALTIPEDLAPRLQLSLCRRSTSAVETLDLVHLAAGSGCPSVAVFPVFVEEAVRAAQGRLKIVARVCPSGMSKPTIKAIEATSCIKDGASELQVEPLPGPQLQGDFDVVKAELQEIARAARATGRPVLLHARLYTSLLFQRGGEGWVEAACQAVRQGAFDGILDRGDDACHTLLRTYAQDLLLTRCCQSPDWDQVRSRLQSEVYRVEVCCDSFGVPGRPDIILPCD